MFNILHPIPERQMVAFKWHFSLSRTKTLQTTTTQPPPTLPTQKAMSNTSQCPKTIFQLLPSVYKVCIMFRYRSYAYIYKVKGIE